MANYSKGKIAIPRVTGNIVINVTAVPSAPLYTNLVPTSINSDGSIFNGTGYKDGYRLNSSGTEAAQAGSSVTGFIPFSIGDTLRIGGEGVLWNSEDTALKAYIYAYDSNFQKLTHQQCVINIYGKIQKVNGVYTYTLGEQAEIIKGTGGNTIIANESTAYIRVSAICNGENLIITKNQEIP